MEPFLIIREESQQTISKSESKIKVCLVGEVDIDGLGARVTACIHLTFP